MVPMKLTSEEAASGMAADLLKETREELTRADSKASTLMAAVMIVYGVIIAAAFAGQWSPFSLKVSAAAVWWLMAGTSIIVLGALMVCIYPRTGNKVAKGLPAYYRHVLQYETLDDLVRGLRDGGATPLDRTSNQLYAISRIVARKYTCLRVAIWSLAATGALGIAVLLLQHLT